MAGKRIRATDAKRLASLLRTYEAGQLAGDALPAGATRFDAPAPVRAMLLADLETAVTGDTAAVDAVVTLVPDDPDPAAVQYVIRITTGVLPDDEEDSDPLEWRFKVGTSHTPAISEEATAAELQALLEGMTELAGVSVDVVGPGDVWGDDQTAWNVRQWFVRLTPDSEDLELPELTAAVPLVDQATASVTPTRWWPTERVVQVFPLWPLSDALFAGTFIWAEWKGRAFNVVSHECWEQGE